MIDKMDYFSDGFCDDNDVIRDTMDMSLPSQEEQVIPEVISKINGAFYYIYSIQYEAPLCWDNKALIFTTENYARRFADSCLWSDLYVIIHKEFEWTDGYILADDLVVRLSDKLNKDGSWTCNDILVKVS